MSYNFRYARIQSLYNKYLQAHNKYNNYSFREFICILPFGYKLEI